MPEDNNKSPNGFESFEEVRYHGNEREKAIVTSDVNDDTNKVDNLLQTVIAYMKRKNIPINRIPLCIDFFYKM